LHIDASDVFAHLTLLVLSGRALLRVYVADDRQVSEAAPPTQF